MRLPATIDPYPGFGIVAAVSLHAVFDALLLTCGLARDHRADRQTDNTGSGSRTGITTATPTEATAAASALHLDDQRIDIRMRHQIFRHGACQRRGHRWRWANQQAKTNQRADSG